MISLSKQFVDYLLSFRHNSYWGGLIFDLLIKTYRFDGFEFYVPIKHTSRSLRSRFLFNVFENDEIEAIRRFLDPSDHVLELGGFIGVTACIANRILLDPSKHVVVEANPYIIDALKTNRAKNSCFFHVVHGLVSSSLDGTFYIANTTTASSTSSEEGLKLNVPVVNLRALQKDYDINFSSFIIDIEGEELSFLRDSDFLLSKARLVIIELHETIIGKSNVDQCRNILSQYDLKRVFSKNLTDVWLRS